MPELDSFYTKNLEIKFRNEKSLSPAMQIQSISSILRKNFLRKNLLIPSAKRVNKYLKEKLISIPEISFFIIFL